MAGLLEGFHEGADIGRRLAGGPIVVYHLVVDSDGGEKGSGNGGEGRLTRTCIIKSEGTGCVNDELQVKTEEQGDDRTPSSVIKKESKTR